MSKIVFVIDEKHINDLVKDSMFKTINLARAAHYTNILMRIGGQDKNFEADWIKYLERVEP
jgi:hypothetical protein